MLNLYRKKESSVAEALALSGEKGHNTLDYTNKNTLDFVEKLYQEYLPIFAEQERKIFHIGGDEFYVLPEKSNVEFVNFMNQLNRFLNKKGFTTRIWNDGFTKADLSSFDKNLEVTYWSLTGIADKDDVSEKSLRSKEYKATAQEISNAGFRLLNFNAYYNYLVPSEKVLSDEALHYTINDLLTHWEIDEFELNTNEKLNSLDNVVGSAVSIWGEEAKEFSDSEIFEQTKRVVSAFLEK